ncbi:hypothetical protein RPALISO_186 [Ruegeria phage RpAliso]|nr:hypothetical protein RPALISO_186 [Ruegeria phage RpAliso]
MAIKTFALNEHGVAIHEDDINVVRFEIHVSNDMDARKIESIDVKSKGTLSGVREARYAAEAYARAFDEGLRYAANLAMRLATHR